MTNINLSNLNTTQGIKILHSTIGEHTKLLEVSSVGDFNGDGFCDFIFGAPYTRDDYNNVSTSYVIFGKKEGYVDTDLVNFSSSEGFAITSVNEKKVLINNDDNYYYGRDESLIFLGGHFVGGGGDINKDGYDDLIIGIPTINDKAGVSYVLFGKASNFTTINLNELTVGSGFSIFSTMASEESGFSVDILGDFNGDGYDDIIIGASPFYDVDKNGTSYIVFGKANNFTDINLSELTIEQGFSILGESRSSGLSVSGAGDFNKDGYADVVIGDPFIYYNGKDSAGVTYVVFGKSSNFFNINLSSLDISQGFKLLGARSYDNFGRFVNEAGDFNGDGYSDIIIGAREASIVDDDNCYNIPNTCSVGVSYVIFGNNKINTVVDMLYLNNSVGFFMQGIDNFDEIESVSGAGDINGDGYSDIIIGSNYGSHGYGDNSIAYVIYGRQNFNNIELSNLSENQGFSILGSKEIKNAFGSNAGDVNGDGYDDILLGIRIYNEGDNKTDFDRSAIGYLIFGEFNGMTAAPTLTPSNMPTFQPIEEPSSNPTKFPTSLPSSVLLSSSPTSLPSTIPTGKPSSIPSIPPTGIPTSTPSALPTGSPTFHSSVQSKPTLSPTSASTFSDSGAAQNKDLGSVYNTIIGANTNDNIGLSVSGIGDFNGDGYGDIIVSSIYESSFKGKIYVIFGKSTKLSNLNVGSLSEAQGFSITGGSSYDFFGTTLNAAGDFNGDGYDDIIVGAPSAGGQDGRVYVVFGKSSGFSDITVNGLSNTEGFSIYGVQDSRCGSSVSSAGDVNGDGYDDIIIGASESEKIYVIFGKSSGFSTIYLDSLSSSDGYVISGDGIGFAVSGAGDFNGDGYDDVIIGAASSSPKSNKEGITYILYGKASGFSSVDLSSITIDQGFKIIGDNDLDQIGYTVSSIGDFNNDGYNDVLVGAPFALSNKGISYVVYGNKTISNNIDLADFDANYGVEIIGELTNGGLGISLKGAGDMNKDGYDDIVLGANSASPKTYHEGLSYVLYGNAEGYSKLSVASLTKAPGFILTGEDYADVSGTAVSGAGDLNNDGYDDVIISAPFAENYDSENNVGKVYIIYGAASQISREINSGGVYIGTSSNENFIIDSSSDVTLTGSGGNDLFTVKPSSNTKITITDFDKENEKINLSFFDNIQGIEDFTITSGSAIVNLANDQTIRLLGLEPSDITSDNFIFSSVTDDDDDGADGGYGNLIGYGILAGVGLVALSVLSCSGFAAYKCCCSGSNKVAVAPDYDMT